MDYRGWFILGLVVGLIVAWVLGQVMGWLKGAFKPPTNESFGQRLASRVRKLAASLLVLLALAAVGYLVYTIVFK